MDGGAVQFYEVGKNEGNCRIDSDGLLCLYQNLNKLLLCFKVFTLPVSVLIVLSLACFHTN